MQLVSTPRIEFLRGLREEIAHDYPKGRVVVAVDGRRGAGTAEFADGLAEVFREAGTQACRASVEDFHRPRAERRRRGADSAEGYYRDSFDERTLRRALLEPFRMAGSTGFQLAAFDVRRDAPLVASWETGPADLVLIVDGPFLLKPELRGAWNYCVHLEVSVEQACARLAVSERRDPDPAADSNARYVGGWAVYESDARPREAAAVVVDNADPEHPLRLYADTGCAGGC